MIFAAVVLTAAAIALLGAAGRSSRRLQDVVAPQPAAEATPGARSWLLTVAVAVIAGLVLGAPMAAVGAAAVVALRQAHELRARRALRAACAAAVPAVCRTLAAELAAGMPPPEALAAAASTGTAPLPLRQVLTAAAAADRLGLDPASVLGDPPAGCHRLRLVGACWRVCTAAGGGLGPAMSRLAGALHDEQDAQAAVTAELVGPRLSARVMAGLPIFGLGLGLSLGADPLHFLRSPPGITCVALAAALDVVGLWWMSRLARAALR